MARENTTGNLNPDRNWHLNTASPRYFLTQRFEAGLRAREFWRAAFPSREAQWHCGAPTLTYRCGGSTGIGRRSTAPVSRLSRVKDLNPGTWNRVAVSANQRRRNDYTPVPRAL